ncbi:MAG: SCP2 sterol-binding domain-containing protein [Acidobacteria bacterium]|nr:SCP2 sterol-binding domain-containing protein [Acidobacteriota bacterium]
MAAFLSDEWLAVGVAEASGLPAVPGASIRLQQVVTGGPEGDVRYVTVIDDGRTVQQRRASDDEADVTITTTYADAVAIQQGTLDINTGFMQGRVKVAGNMAKLLDLLPLTTRTEWRDVQARIAAATDFPN